VLGALAGQPSSSTLSEVAKATDLPKTTTLRLLSSLEDLGMVERIEGRYLLGHGITALTRNTSPASALRAVARPYLSELSERYGENVSVGIDDGSELLYIDTAHAPGAVQVGDWTGRRVAFHTDAAGLVVMSAWTPERLSRYASTTPVTDTSLVATSLADLERRAEAIRADGFVCTLGEFSADVNGISAPVMSNSVLIGAVNVYGPAYRWPGDASVEEIVTDVTDVCARISGRFAGDE
jgi:DNA-binding IclR family transcriptional regulator